MDWFTYDGLRVPICKLLSRGEEILSARRIQASLARIRALLPRHPIGYRRFLSSMEERLRGRSPLFPWHRRKRRLTPDLVAAKEHFRSAEQLAAVDPPAAATALEKGAKILLRYPLFPETLHQWAREASRSPLGGPVGELPRVRKVEGVLRRVLAILKRERDRLIVPNLRLVLSLTLRFRPRGLSRSDLFQEGCFGLHKAAFRFDPERGHRFSTYAMYWIRQAIRLALLDRSSFIRVPQSAQLQLRRNSPDLSPAECKRLRRVRSGPIFFSAMVPPDEEGTYEPRDQRRQGFEETLHLETVPQAVDEAIQKLNDLEREIVTRRFGIGTPEETLEEVWKPGGPFPRAGSPDRGARPRAARLLR